MKQEINNITETRKEIVVTLSAEEFKNAEAQVFSEFSKHANIPGFRPGKAPEAIIRKKYSKRIDEELQKQITSNAYSEVSKNEAVDIYNIVDIKEPETFSAENTSLTFVVDTWPKIDLPKYEEISVKEEEIKVTPEEKASAVDKMREQMAEYKTVERPAAEGDYVRVSYEGKIDGKLIAEIAPEIPMYGTQNRTWEQAGKTENEEYSIAAISNALVGMKSDDTKEVTHEFPKDFKLETLAGKVATYGVTVHEVKEKLLPEIDEAFFKKAGVENMDELHAKMEEDFIRSKKQRNMYAKRSQILQTLEERPDFDLPEASLEQEKNQTMYSIMQERMTKGASEEELQNSKSEIEEEALTKAKKSMKSRMILSKIAEKEKIEVDNQDIYNELLKQSYMVRKPVDEIIKLVQKDRSALMAVQREALFYKTLDFLGEKATIVTEVSEK